MMKAKTKSKFARIFLQLFYLAFLGYHAACALHTHFGFKDWYDVFLIISVIEFSVILIDLTGLNKTLWYAKVGLLLCSVFFSLYGFKASYNDQKNLILDLEKNSQVVSKDTKIDSIKLKIDLLNLKRPSLVKKSYLHTLLGDKAIGIYKNGINKGKPYYAYDVVRWTDNTIESIDKHIIRHKESIISLLESKNSDSVLIAQNNMEIQKQRNNLELHMLKYASLAFLVIFIAILNMFISNVTRKIEETFETPDERIIRIEKQIHLKEIKLNLKTNLKPSLKNKLLFSFGFISYIFGHQNKASPN